MAAEVGPLAGIRILDFTQGIAGPLATKDLANLGASVIKVEWNAGDWSRQIGPKASSGDGALFIACNGDKLSLHIKLDVPTDWDLLARLGRAVDATVTDWLTDEKLVAWTEELAKENSRVVKARLEAAPSSLQVSIRVTSELAAQAYSGLWQYQGAWYEDDFEPVRVGVDVSSVWTGVALSQGVMLALIDREVHRGPAESVEVSQLGATIVNQICHFGWDSNPTETHPTIGASAPYNPPYHGIRTADNNIVMTLGDSLFGNEDAAHAAFHEAFGIDPRWNERESRLADAGGLLEAWREALSSVPSDEVIGWVVAHQGRAVPLNTMASMARHDQVAAMDMIQNVTLSNGDPVTTVGLPWKFSKTPAAIHAGPPALGAHNAAIIDAGWPAAIGG